MGRKNHSSGRRPQARRRADGFTPPPRPANMRRVPVEEMVVPKGRCPLPHRKLRFSEEEVAVALRQAQHNRRVQGSQHAEERSYLCDACGDYHLTSRTSYTPRGQA